jgi:RNA polymerase sigma factor (sigma-70 family)
VKAAGRAVSTVGDEEFVAFLDCHGPRLRRALVAAYGIDAGLELHAEVIAWAWEHWSAVAETEHPVGYLFRVGQSRARRLWRWRRRVVFPPEPPSAAQEALDGDLAEALKRLRLPQRTAVILVHAYGWSYADVADLLDVSEGSVRNHLHRGILRLRAELGGQS